MDHAGFLKLLNETANKYGKAKPIFLENSVPTVQIRFFLTQDRCLHMLVSTEKHIYLALNTIKAC